MFPGRRNAERAVVSGREPAFAARTSACASRPRNGAACRWNHGPWRPQPANTVLQLRHGHGVPGLVWRGWVSIYALFRLGGHAGVDRRRGGGTGRRERGVFVRREISFGAFARAGPRRL